MSKGDFLAAKAGDQGYVTRINGQLQVTEYLTPPQYTREEKLEQAKSLVKDCLQRKEYASFRSSELSSLLNDLRGGICNQQELELADEEVAWLTEFAAYWETSHQLWEELNQLYGELLDAEKKPFRFLRRRALRQKALRIKEILNSEKYADGNRDPNDPERLKTETFLNKFLT